MEAKLLIVWVLIFLFGWLAHSVVSQVPAHVERTAMNFSDSLFTAVELPSPADRISESQVHVLQSRVVIDLEDAEWATFVNTNSMDPLIDVGSNTIEIIPKGPEELQVGDIISYINPLSDGTIIHRIVEIGDDGQWFARVKGDNVDIEDPGKVRFKQIQRVVVGILY